MVPIVFSVCSDAYVSLGRISEFFLAEEQAAPFMIKQDAEYAVDVDGDFSWEVVDPIKIKNTKGAMGNATSAKATRQQRRKDKKDTVDKKGAKAKSDNDTPVASGSGSANSGVGTPTVQEEEEKDHSNPFTLEDLNLKIPRGSFVAISGRIGSGKSSVLNALIGEMRRTKGEVSFWICTVWLRLASFRRAGRLQRQCGLLPTECVDYECNAEV
jgi:ATP-binding cassette subfamily C (CFTR/MRP) protein 1